MFSNVVIRKAIPEDLDLLSGLLESLFTIETDFIVDKEKQRRGLEILLREEGCCCVLVAEVHQKVVGMCTAQLLISTAEGGLKAILEDLVIREDCRQQGIGKQIIAAVEKWAYDKGVKRLDLLADQRNTPALRFYANSNWAPTELICLQKKL